MAAITSNTNVKQQARFRNWLGSTGWYIIMIAFALVTALPFFWTGLMASRQNSGNVFSSRRPPELIGYPGVVGWGYGYNEARGGEFFSTEAEADERINFATALQRYAERQRDQNAQIEAVSPELEAYLAEALPVEIERDRLVEPPWWQFRARNDYNLAVEDLRADLVEDWLEDEKEIEPLVFGWWTNYQPSWEPEIEGAFHEEYVFPVTTQNYYNVWQQIPLGRYFLNSIIVSLSTVVLNVITCSMAAYPLAKMRFKGRNIMFMLILSTLVFPPQLTMIPLYVMAVNVFGFTDTLYGLVLPFATNAFGIFLLRQIYQSVPDELMEAARLDGATEFGIWWRILLPLIRPGIATLSIITFVTAWNDFLWPLLMLNDNRLFTLPVGLSYLNGFFSGNLRTVAAGIVIATVPMILFFIAFQKQFIRGLAGAVKG